MGLFIRLGTYTFNITSQNHELISILRERLMGFYHTGDSRFSVVLRPLEADRVVHNTDSVDGLSVEFQCSDSTIQVGIEQLSEHNSEEIVNFILPYVYAHSAVSVNNKSWPGFSGQFYNGFVLHAAAISYYGRGCIFTGPSGAGKSTISSLFLEAKETTDISIINDETVIVERAEPGYMVYPTPFRPTVPFDPDSAAPLEAIFVLAQTPEPRIEKIQTMEAVSLILGQMHPRFILQGIAHITADQKFDLVCELVSKVPVYRLGFRKDLSFLPLLEHAVMVGSAKIEEVVIYGT